LIPSTERHDNEVDESQKDPKNCCSCRWGGCSDDIANRLLDSRGRRRWRRSCRWLQRGDLHFDRLPLAIRGEAAHLELRFLVGQLRFRANRQLIDQPIVS
jgi:hypothetical protein